MFEVNWPFSSRFSRWKSWGPSWISDRNDFSYFWSTSHLDANKFQINWAFDSGEEAEKRFSRWLPSWILDRNNISYFFYLQVIPILPTKFQLNFLPFGSGEEAKNRFSRWLLWRPSWISDQNNFSYFFYLQVTPILPTKFQLIFFAFWFWQEKNIFSRWQSSWISNQNIFSYFSSSSHPNASYQVSTQLAFWFRRWTKNRF